MPVAACHPRCLGDRAQPWWCQDVGGGSSSAAAAGAVALATRVEEVRRAGAVDFCLEDRWTGGGGRDLTVMTCAAQVEGVETGEAVIEGVGFDESGVSVEVV